MNDQMINSKELCEYLKLKGYKFASSVPCSILKEFLKALNADNEISHISAARENISLGLASGAYLANKKAFVLMQNSGLGNIVNTLTSFNMLYKVPSLIFVTWRGFEGKDAPEHLIMGKKLTEYLELLDLPFKVLSSDYKTEIDWADNLIDKSRLPVVLIVKKGIIK